MDLGDDQGVAVLEKQDGATVYLSRDIAAVVDRKDRFKFDQLLYVVSWTEQIAMNPCCMFVYHGFYSHF